MEHITKRAGTMTVNNRSKNTSQVSIAQAKGGFSGVNYSDSYASRPLFLPPELYGLHRRKSIIFLKEWKCPIVADRVDWFDVPEWKQEVENNKTPPQKKPSSARNKKPELEPET